MGCFAPFQILEYSRVLLPLRVHGVYCREFRDPPHPFLERQYHPPSSLQLRLFRQPPLYRVRLRKSSMCRLLQILADTGLLKTVRGWYDFCTVWLARQRRNGVFQSHHFSSVQALESGVPKLQLGHGVLSPRLNKTTKCPSLCSTPQYGGLSVCLNLRNVHSIC